MLPSATVSQTRQRRFARSQVHVPEGRARPRRLQPERRSLVVASTTQTSKRDAAVSYFGGGRISALLHPASSSAFFVPSLRSTAWVWRCQRAVEQMRVTRSPYDHG